MVYDTLIMLVGEPHSIGDLPDILVSIGAFSISLNYTYFLENISMAMCSQKRATNQINKFKFFCKFTVAQDGSCTDL